MTDIQMRQFSEESKQELGQLLADFFKRHIQSETPLANIEVEIKFKQSSESLEAQPIMIFACSSSAPPSHDCPPGTGWIDTPPS